MRIYACFLCLRCLPCWMLNGISARRQGKRGTLFVAAINAEGVLKLAREDRCMLGIQMAMLVHRYVLGFINRHRCMAWRQAFLIACRQHDLKIRLAPCSEQTRDRAPIPCLSLRIRDGRVCW